MSTRIVLLAATLAAAVFLVKPAAAAADPDFVCWDLDNGEVECESYAVFKAICDLIDNNNELCRIVLGAPVAAGNLAAAPQAGKNKLPPNARYVAMQQNRAELTSWRRAKATFAKPAGAE